MSEFDRMICAMFEEQIRQLRGDTPAMLRAIQRYRHFLEGREAEHACLSS